MDEPGRKGESEKWSNLAFCAERERERDGGRDKERMRQREPEG